MFDKDKNMYSYQYTLLHLAFGPFVPKVAMVALTDYKNDKHYYLQETTLTNNKVIVSEIEASYKNVAMAIKENYGIKIKLTHKDFTLDLMCEYGKGASWHCDNGFLQMGIEDEKATTLYYSFIDISRKAPRFIYGDIRLAID